jgi:hypothetical protein
MTNLTQQQLDELGKLLETNQGSDVDEFLEQIFNAAQTEPKNTDTLYETSPATDSEHLETLHEQPPEFHTDNAQTLLGEYCTDDPPEPISQTRGKNRQADLADTDMVNRFGDYELLGEIARGGMELSTKLAK